MSVPAAALRPPFGRPGSPSRPRHRCISGGAEGVALPGGGKKGAGQRTEERRAFFEAACPFLPLYGFPHSFCSCQGLRLLPCTGGGKRGNACERGVALTGDVAERGKRGSYSGAGEDVPEGSAAGNAARLCRAARQREGDGSGNGKEKTAGRTRECRSGRKDRTKEERPWGRGSGQKLSARRFSLK